MTYSRAVHRLARVVELTRRRVENFRTRSRQPMVLVPRGRIITSDEEEFRNLWKLFFLVLVAHTLREYGISSQNLRDVIQPLEEARLLPRNISLRGILQTAFGYVRRIMRGDPMALETTINLILSMRCRRGSPDGFVSLNQPCRGDIGVGLA